MLSLAKLSALASEEADDSISTSIDEIETHLHVIKAQEKLPNEALQKLQMKKETMKVMTPREIIEVIKHFITSSTVSI